MCGCVRGATKLNYLQIFTWVAAITLIGLITTGLRGDGFILIC